VNRSENKMPGPYTITPSILAADFTCLEDQIKQAEAGGADWIHVDVMDGHFVPNLTMGPIIVKACRKITQLPLDVHLMIERPEQLIPAFVEAGASLLYVHVETCPNLHRTLQSIHELSCRAAVVINPGTPAGSIEAVLTDVDVVLVMTVNPGFGGQEFIPSTVPKIARVRQMLDEVNPTARIAVDGGISTDTLDEVVSAGAQIFIAGTSIFHYPAGIAAGIQALRDHLPR
jgi:ribulose-phosphate 3-epimerase